MVGKLTVLLALLFFWSTDGPAVLGQSCYCKWRRRVDVSATSGIRKLCAHQRRIIVFLTSQLDPVCIYKRKDRALPLRGCTKYPHSNRLPASFPMAPHHHLELPRFSTSRPSNAKSESNISFVVFIPWMTLSRCLPVQIRAS